MTTSRFGLPRSSCSCLGVLALVMTAAAFPADSAYPADQANATATVGVRNRIEQLVLPGSELEVRPIEDRKAPIVLRLAAAFPHGSAYRYDLVYYGLEPGAFDLKDYVRRKDGSSSADLPAIPVSIVSALPPGQILPSRLPPSASPSLGGYRLAAMVAGAVWVVGLLGILFWRRRRRQVLTTDQVRPVTLADRLRPLVQRAILGELSVRQSAELERTLLACWRRRLNLQGLKPADAMARLRHHDQAGPLLEQLDEWLHRPGKCSGLDIAELLKPYEDAALDELVSPEVLDPDAVPVART